MPRTDVSALNASSWEAEMKAPTNAPDAHIQAGVGGLFLVFTWISMKKDAWAVGAICAKAKTLQKRIVA